MSNATSTRPTHRAYLVTGEGNNRRWHELGPVWSHKDGEGFSLMPYVLPAAGQTITIRKITTKGDAEVPPQEKNASEGAAV